MAYEFNVKNKKVIFSNDVVKDLELFELEFITDAPKLCRKFREEIKRVHDPFRKIHTANKKQIKFSYDTLDAPSNFRLRFCHPYNPAEDIAVQVTIKEW